MESPSPQLQLSVLFVPREDRVLLRVGFGTSQVSCWLTRKISRSLLPALAAVEQRALAKPEVPAALQAHVVDFQRQDVLGRADFNTPYAPARASPWGDEVKVVGEFSLEMTAAQMTLLKLSTIDGALIDLRLDKTLLAALRELLLKAVAGAQWDLAPAPGPVAGPSSQPLH